jgi:hypothetical protein
VDNEGAACTKGPLRMRFEGFWGLLRARSDHLRIVTSFDEAGSFGIWLTTVFHEVRSPGDHENGSLRPLFSRQDAKNSWAPLLCVLCGVARTDSHRNAACLALDFRAESAEDAEEELILRQSPVIRFRVSGMIMA